MSQDLRILITAGLDGISSQREIQKQLDTISKNLSLSLGIDTSNMGNVQKQISELQKQVSGLTGKGVKIIDDQEAIKNIDQAKKGVTELYTDIDKAVKRYSQFGTVKVDKVFHPLTKELQGFNLQIERANGLVDKLKLDLVKIATPQGQNAFEVVSRKQINNTQKMLEQQDQLRTKVEATARSKKQSLEQELQLYREQARLNAQNIKRTHGTTVDNASLDQYQKRVRSLTIDTPNLSHKMRELDMEFKKISGSARTAAGSLAQSGMAVSEMMRTALVKFPINIQVG